ncbi:MAG TPA: HAD-IIIA family hydrolase [Steroidobacteraceae bacterium]|jgi:3-deoxy-D-manno-octulosonate 8-phosphate phosphatase (KDO 8-P phosphatase)|nr:HAD-IIIA family hydrolase [Steroidobacteraceae bacterium]
MPAKRSDPAAIELLVLDVDGVLTDGRLYYGARGEVLKVFDVKDGLGIKRLMRAGVTVAIISGRRSPMVARRARDLGIVHVFQGSSDKLPIFERLRKRLKLEPAACAVVGDDLPDVPLMRAAGLAFAVADAHPSAIQAADRVTPQAGGRGAVRSVCDLLLAARARTVNGSDERPQPASSTRRARANRSEA